MLNELNHVIDYIEDYLTDDLSLEMISEYAGVSDYHFRKIFFYLSGLTTLSEYIKNRKLSEANRELLDGEKVTEVAFKYGYQSIDGFTRAFKKWSGFLPSDVMKKGINKSFPSTLQETMAKVYSEWLPSSNYEVINAPSFSFTKMDQDKKDYAYSEVWIPVRKK